MAFLPSVIPDTVGRYRGIGCLLVELSPPRRADGDAMSPDGALFRRRRPSVPDLEPVGRPGVSLRGYLRASAAGSASNAMAPRANWRGYLKLSLVFARAEP